MKGSDIYVNQEAYVDGDPKPSGAFIGQELKATNGKVWEWSGSTWNLTVTTTSDGSAAELAVIADRPADPSMSQPHQRYLKLSRRPHR